MTDAQIVELMKSSKNEQEWSRNADQVKKSYGGHYPESWFKIIMLSGIASTTVASWR